jgi:chromosome segregation ATPase
MDEIEQYQTRIFAALDKVSRLTSELASVDAAPAPVDDGLRQRDLALIEELEATLAEERLDLDAERDMVATLKGKLVEAERALEEAQAAGAAVAELEAAAQEAGAAKADLQRQLDAAQADIDAAQQAAEAAAREAERAQQQREKEQERQNNATSHLEETIARLTARIENQDVQFQRLKGANAQLRDSNAMLRERNVDMLGDADAIDQSMRAELEALKTTRASDVEEMNTILDELKPLVKEQANG